MLQGTIIKHGESLAIECTSPMLNEPKMVRHVWEIARYRVAGMSWRSEQEAIGRDATIRDGRVRCYLGEGCYLDGELADLGATPAVLVETLDIPCPRARTQTRWHYGRWEKYSKRSGWIPA